MNAKNFSFLTSFLYLAITVITMSNCQDIAFPAEENHGQLGADNNKVTERVPVHIPGRCPPNMLLYPGQGDKSAWICDCMPGYLYFPLNNTCHPAYRRGPCRLGEYVVLPQNEVVPQCVYNPCRMDGAVPFGGACYYLHQKGPCANGAVGVNEDNYQLECIQKK